MKNQIKNFILQEHQKPNLISNGNYMNYEKVQVWLQYGLHWPSPRSEVVRWSPDAMWDLEQRLLSVQ